jgi:hypothetical protein
MTGQTLLPVYMYSDIMFQHKYIHHCYQYSIGVSDFQ